MTHDDDGRNPPEGRPASTPYRSGRILNPIIEEQREKIRALSHDQLQAVRKGCAAELAKNFPLQYAPEPKVQDNGKPFRVRGEPMYFYSGGKTYYPDDAGRAAPVSTTKAT